MKTLRLLLFPFAIVYDLVTHARNWAFDKGFLEQRSFSTPIIAIGNLSTGGTGKTPMTEYLIRQFEGRIAVLSRGYGRKTSGFKMVEVDSAPSEVGDEPLQIKRKFGAKITSAVCEKRVDGVERLIGDNQPDLILLDDAYQHRYVKADHYVLLTAFGDPYYNDFVLPAGNLRESRQGANRAHSIVVTKCPPDISQADMAKIKQKIKPLPHQQVYFSTIAYSENLYSKSSDVSLKEFEET